MGSNVYYFDYCEEDLPENMDTGILHLKNKNSYQRPPSSSGVTSYIKNRRPPPLIPRQLPRPKLVNQKPQLPPRQTNTQKECPTQSLHRNSSPVTFRLYSIPEKEEDIHGESSLKRRTMSEQKPKYSTTEPDISKTNSSGIQKSDHYGSMPDMSASGGLKPQELGRRESAVDPVDVSSDFSFMGTEPLFSSSPIPHDKEVFNFNNLQDQNNEQNMEETHQSDDKTMYHTATSQVIEANMESDNKSTESIPGSESGSISDHTKTRSSNFDQNLLRRASSGKLKETELNPLKTVDSVRQYFTKPSELLKLKLKHTNQENEQQLSNRKETVDFVKEKEHQSSPHQKPVPSPIKVVQYEEKVFKEAVESKLKEHDTIEQEKALKEVKVKEEFQKDTVNKLSNQKDSSDNLRLEQSHKTDKILKQADRNEKTDILQRSYSEPKRGQPIRFREDRKYRSHDRNVGYDARHDFTSVVDFLEVLKCQEEKDQSRMTGSHVTPSAQREADEEEKEDFEFRTVEESMDNGQESVRTNDTGTVRSIVDFIETRKQKYTPVVPSPLTYTTSSNLLEKGEEPEEMRQNVQGDGEMGYRIVPGDVTSHGTNIGESTLSDTTTSRLLEKVDIREGRENKQTLPGYATSSKLGMEKQESNLSYTTPSKLLEKVEIRAGRRSKEKFPGYGEMEHTTTPSNLGMEKQESSLSYTSPSNLEMEKYESTLSYATPSMLGMEKQESTLSYTTPSQLEMEKYESTLSYATPSMLGMQKQGSTLSYTTPSKLLDRVEIREGRRKKEKFPGYGEMEYTTPSKLGMEKQESNLSYTSPSKLLEKVEIRESREKKLKFPGYGEMDYTTASQLGMIKSKEQSMIEHNGNPTPSELVDQVETREVKRQSSPGTLNYITPSELLDFSVQQEQERNSCSEGSVSDTLSSEMYINMEEKSGHGDSSISIQLELADLTPKPSNKRLADRTKKQEQMSSPNITTEAGASSEEGYKGLLHRVLSAPNGKFSYSLDTTEPSGKHGQSKENGNLSTTPSKLLEKIETRERREKKEKFPGYGVLDYTTPSKLAIKNREKVESDQQVLYPTSSKLLEKVETREKRAKKEIFPGYGVLEYRTPSKLVSEPYEEKRAEEQPFFYTTPSELLKNIIERERREMSSGYSLLEYETQSKMAAEQNKTRSHKDLLEMHTSPSKLLEKVNLREKRRKKEEFSGYGVLDYKTPSNMTAEHSEESANNKPILYHTPSKLLDENEVRGKRQNLPGVLDKKAPSKLFTENKEKIDDQAQILYTTPSKLLEKVEKREARERRKEREFRYHDGRKSMHYDLSYTTPSKLLEKVEKREDRACRKDQPGYGTLEYTTPSKLIGLSQSQQEDERMPSGTDIEVHRNGKRSLEECGSPTISELFEVVRQGNYGNRAPESTHYGSPTISEVFEMVRHGNRAPESTRYGSFSSTTPSIIAKKLGYGDSKTSFQQEELSETTKQGNRRLGYRPRMSGQALNKEQMVQSDMMTSAPTEDDSERLLHLHKIASAPNRLSNDMYDANRSLNDSGLDTETSSLTENEKSKDEKRSQREREAILSHIHSDITAYFSKQSNEDGYPNKRHRSEPEFFGSFCDYSHPSLIDEDTAGAYNIKGTEPLLSSSSSSGGAIVPVETSPVEPPDAIVMDDLQYDEVQKYKAKVQNKHLFLKESEISSSYPMSLDSLRYRESLSSLNPSFQAFASDSFTEESTSSGKSSEESIPMYKPLDDTVSINQLFWSMYSSYPDLMQRFLNSDTGLPSQSALNSLSDLYSNAPRSFTCDDHQNIEVRYSTDTQKKRALPQSPTSSAPDSRSFFMEKELMESQNRKLQLEISTLTTENKLFKDKYNRSAAKISDLEEELNETKSDYESLQQSVNEEVSEVQRKSKSQMAQDMDYLQSKVTSLVQENEHLKSEVMYLETQLQTANGVVEMARQNNEKNKTLEAYKMEVASLKDEVSKVKSLLEQSERHLHEEETRSRETSQQVIKLTEMKNLLQHEVDMSGGGNTVVDKQIKSLEKRLRVTEERLHQERSDRANNLSAVEDKLLTENARLQATEKELSRQLQREKDKNCNLEQKTKDVKNENEKLRLQVPFDETSLTSLKYDIPYSTHSSQRHESVKNHDVKHIASQLEQQAGVKSELDMICHLWITREQAYSQLRHLEIMLQDLNLRDNDVTEGLKNLRDLKHQYELKLKQAEEKAEDSKSEKFTFEATYKEQLTSLVKERHEAFAKLKTAEDLLEATRSENEILRNNLPALSAGSMQSLHGKDSEKQIQLVHIQELEGKVQSLTRSNQMSEGEITTLKVQMEAREKTLRDVESELELANSKMDLGNGDERKQQKIDKLTAQVNSKQVELGLMNDKYNRLLAENRSLEMDLDITKLDLTSIKTKQRQITGIADTKMSFSVKEELEDKSRQIEKMTEEIEKLDSALQQTRQDLYQEQLQCNDFEGQVEGMQQEFEERGRIIDAISETEKEQLSQYKILKSTLDSVHADLKKKEGQIKIQEVELSQQTDKIHQLERKLSSHNETPGGVMVPETLVTELERDKIKSELLEAYSKLKTTEEEMQEMASELQKLQEEVTNQKADLLQLSSEKGELEQHLEEIAEEHDALIQEKAQSEEDIVKLENKLQELVETLENEARKQLGNFGNQYDDVPAEFSQMAEELGTLRSLLESKDKELEMFQTKASRQQMDLEFLQRRIELLHSDNQSNREDIARMTNQLILKMKEGVESRQLNEFLSGERVQQQKELTQLEQNLERTAQLQVVKQTEIEKSEFSKKDATISLLEKSLEQVRKSLQENEYENVQLRYQVETLTNDQRKLSTINSSLETKLEMEKKMYEERHQEVTSSNHKLDLLQREHDHVLNNLNTEKQLKEKLNNDSQIYSSENKNLRQELRDIQSELDDCQKQLNSSQDALKDAKQDKGVMYHEYENMIKRMSEKDQKIIELQTKLDITVADMEKELHLQKHTHELEKTSTERELDITKEQVTTLSSEMKNKDSELSTFGRSLQELEEATRKKKEVEIEHEKSQMAVHDMKILLDSHKKEIQQLQESLSRHQENVSRTQLEKAGVEDKLYRLEESSTVQIQELKKTIADMKSANEREKSYLKDNLSQTQSQIQSLQSSLSSAVTSRDKLQIECRLLQRTVEETREQLHDTSTSRKVAEQRADTLEGQLHDSRKDRFLTEEKLNQSLSTISKLEREQKSDREKLKAAIEASQEYEATAYGQQSNARAKQEKVDVLQNEVGKLKQILESQKVQMNSKLKKSAKDLSQQMELIESDRNKLSQQNTQLFNDLEKSRETVQIKNKENLKLQEDMLQLQEQVKELSFKLKHSDEARKTEEELQVKLQKKLDEQEDELKRVRNFLTKKAEESGEAEKSAWHDMNKMIHEMSQQMSMHLESQKTSDGKDQDAKVAQRYKKHIHDLNTELQTERALHKITASSLQSLEEDCVRLRQQCQAMRKRNNSASDKRYKSRMEAINEIIARSQTQAQAMLSSGNYLDESLKSLASPRVTFEASPDNSVCSDMSFNSTIAINSESSPPNPTMKSTPMKS